MPKEDKKKNPEKKIGRNAQDEGFEFGVNELAKELDLEPASVRVKLRNLEIPKAGAVYGWKDQKAFDSVVKKMRASGRASKDEPAKDTKKSAGAGKGEGKRGRRSEAEEAAAG